MQKLIFDIPYKIAAFDLDGTLVGYGNLSIYAKKVLQALCDKGVVVVIATGRPLPFIPDDLKDMDGIRYIISSSGACVTDIKTHQKLFQLSIPAADAVDALRCIESHRGSGSVFYSNKAVFAQQSVDRFCSYVPKGEFQCFEQEFLQNIEITQDVIGSVKISEQPIEKINGYFDHKSDCMSALCTINDTEKLDAVTIMGKDLEISPRGVNKAVGLRCLCKHLGIDEKEVAAFGDSVNDLEMFKMSGYAVAMAGADDSVKAMADSIAQDLKYDGAARSACELFDINELDM